MADLFIHLKKYLPHNVLESIQILTEETKDKISEIRLRLSRACTITIGNENVVLLNKSGNTLFLDENEISDCFKNICENSVYKYESEIKKGYITLNGGFRVGFCGTKSESGFVKDISSLNFRISKDIENASKDIYPLLFDDEKIYSSLIISSPCAGKTTILSDIARKLSRKKIRVSIVDERCEIAAVHKGRPQKDVGDYCDVLDNYAKGEGMMIALRSLSPQVIICDEIGSDEDVKAMIQAMNAGVPVIATAHGDSLSSFVHRPQMQQLIKSGAVERLFFLTGAHQPGVLRQMFDVRGLYENIRDFSSVCGGDTNHPFIYTSS